MNSKKKFSVTNFLIAVALVLAMTSTVMLLVGLYGSNAAPVETQVPTTEPTEPPTEPEPTLPPPEPNPYGPYDFQYGKRYLKLIEGESITGIDVSYHQKDIDFEKVKASGVEFVIVRMAYRGYGTGKIADDTHAITYLDQACEAGLDVGVYFFSQALTPDEAEEEALYLLEQIRDRDITMPVVYDWEKVSGVENTRTENMDKETLTQCAKVFLETVENAGYDAMLYFNRRQAQKLLDLSQLKEYDFWLAAYTDRMEFPYKIKMWQYTNTGRVPGVEGDCDINIYFPET